MYCVCICMDVGIIRGENALLCTCYMLHRVIKDIYICIYIYMYVLYITIFLKIYIYI